MKKTCYDLQSSFSSIFPLAGIETAFMNSSKLIAPSLGLVEYIVNI